MDLKTALTITKKYAGTEDGFELVTVGHDFVAARNRISGVRVMVETGLDAGAEVQVDAVSAAKVIVKAGKDATMSVGKQLVITGGGVEFKLQITRKQGWPTPDLPAKLRRVTEAEARAIRVIADLASKTKGDDLAVVRLTPYLVCSRQHTTLAVCYVGPVENPVTVPRDFLLGLTACEMGFKNGRLFTITGDALRWTLTIAAAYPDQQGYDLIAAARENLVLFEVDVVELTVLAERALAACRVPADAGYLIVDGDKLGLTLANGYARYKGWVDIIEIDAGRKQRQAGARPQELLRFVKAMKPLQLGDNLTRMSIAGERDVIYMCSPSEPLVEVLMSPVFVPPT